MSEVSERECEKDDLYSQKNERDSYLMDLNVTFFSFLKQELFYTNPQNCF